MDQVFRCGGAGFQLSLLQAAQGELEIIFLPHPRLGPFEAAGTPAGPSSDTKSSNQDGRGTVFGLDRRLPRLPIQIHIFRELYDSRSGRTNWTFSDCAAFDRSGFPAHSACNVSVVYKAHFSPVPPTPSDNGVAVASLGRVAMLPGARFDGAIIRTVAIRGSSG